MKKLRSGSVRLTEPEATEVASLLLELYGVAMGNRGRCEREAAAASAPEARTYWQETADKDSAVAERALAAYRLVTAHRPAVGQ